MKYCKACLSVSSSKAQGRTVDFPVDDGVCGHFDPIMPMTNADHLREAISTEDGLAKFLMKVHDEGIYIPFCQNKKECWDQCPDVPDEKCMECMKEWLRKPYEGD